MSPIRAHPLAVRLLLAGFVVLICAAGTYLLSSGSVKGAVMLAALLLSPYLVYVALVRPLYLPFGLYVLLVPFDNLLGGGPTGTVTKLLGIISGVCLLFWLLRRGELAFRGRPMLALSALLLWMLLSTLWALDQGTALQSVPTYAGLVLLYAALSMFPISKRDYGLLLGLIAISGVVAAGYGAHTFYDNPSLADSADKVRLVIHSGTTAIDPNHFSAALLLPAAVLLMWTLRVPRLLLKLVGMGSLGLITIAIVLSGSRGAFLGLLLLFAYAIVRSRYRLQLVIAGAIAAALVLSTSSSLWVRFSQALQTGGSGRTSIWAVGLEAAKHRLVQGYGIGNFPQAYDLFYIGVHQTYPYGFSSPAHSLVLHYAVELGIVGLALVGWFIWAQFGSLRHIGRSSEFYDYRVMIEGALLAICAESLTIDLFTYKYAWLVFSMVALLANLAPATYAKREIRPASASMMPARSARF